MVDSATAQVLGLGRDIIRCSELEAVLDGRASGCREVASWQGLTRQARGYVQNPAGWSSRRCADLVRQLEPVRRAARGML